MEINFSNFNYFFQKLILNFNTGATRLINLEIKNLVLVYKYPCLNT